MKKYTVLFAACTLLLISCHNNSSSSPATGTESKVPPAEAKAPDQKNGLFSYGKFNIYQLDAMGFSFQYSVKISEGGKYFVHEKEGEYVFRDGLLEFTTGSLKGFKAVFLSFSPQDKNEKRLTLMIDYHGERPDSVNFGRKPSGWYQYGHLAKD